MHHVHIVVVHHYRHHTTVHLAETRHATHSNDQLSNLPIGRPKVQMSELQRALVSNPPGARILALSTGSLDLNIWPSGIVLFDVK